MTVAADDGVTAGTALQEHIFGLARRQEAVALVVALCRDPVSHVRSQIERNCPGLQDSRCDFAAVFELGDDVTIGIGAVARAEAPIVESRVGAEPYLPVHRHVDEAGNGRSVRKEHARVVGVGQSDRRDAPVGKCLQFALVDLRIMIGVLPDAEGCPVGIARIEHTVMVAVVERRQCLEIGVVFLRGEHRERDFRGAGDGAVAVLVEDKDTVIGAGPGGPLNKAVIVEIEKRIVLVARCDLDSVAIEIDQDRLARLAAASVAILRADIAVAVIVAVVARRIIPAPIAAAVARAIVARRAAGATTHCALDRRKA